MRRIYILLSFLLLAGICRPQSTFQGVYSISGNDCGNSVIQTSDGNFVVKGMKLSGSGNNAILLKTNGTGDSVWTKFYPGGNGPALSPNDLLFETDNGLVFSSIFGNGTTLTQTSQNGDSVWTRSIPGIYRGAFRPTKDKGFILCGADSAGRICLLKTDSACNEEWRSSLFSPATFPAYYDDFIVCQTSDQGFIFCGMTKSTTGGGPITYLLNAFIGKSNSTGDSIWSMILDDFPYQSISAILETGDHAFIAGGTMDSVDMLDRTHENPLLMKFSGSGALMWTKVISGQGNQEFRSLGQTEDSGYIAVGANNRVPVPYGSCYYSFYIVRMTSDGDTLWSRNYSAPFDAFGLSIHTASDHGFIACGAKCIENNSSGRIFVLKTDANGYTFPEGINEKELVSNLELFPNPTHGKVSLNCSGKFNLLEVSDISGRIVYRQEIDLVRNKTHTIDLSGNARGIYLLRISNDIRVMAGKIVLK